MGDCHQNSCIAVCAGACVTTCSRGCEGCEGCSGCGNACSTSCTYTCENTCYGKCEGTCKSGCEGTCTASCSDSCYDSCKDDCLTSCKGQCKGYCASICQTYCQKAQTFTKNLSPIANAVGRSPFSWTNSVAEDATIQITASEWNTLRGYIKVATSYCGGTTPSGANVNSNDLITAAQYNDLANGLGVTNVTADKTLISASIIDNLRTAYNNRQIKNTLPNGEYPLTGNQNNCCQKGQTCMAEGQLLSHQKCKTQKPTKCGDQTTGK